MTLLEWQKRISHRVLVEDDVTLGELCMLLEDMWSDAYAEGVHNGRYRWLGEPR